MDTHAFGLQAHCYFTRLNLKKNGASPNRLLVFLGIHRNPKQREMFNSYEGLFEIIPFIYFYPLG